MLRTASFRRVSSDLVDLPVPRRVTIQVVRDASSLAAAAPPGRSAPPWAVGVAYPDLANDLDRAASRRADRRRRFDPPPRAVAHRARQRARAPGAALATRGFAYQHSGEWSWDRSETLAGMAWFGGIIPLDELDHGFPAEELPASTRMPRPMTSSASWRGEDGSRTDSDVRNRWPFASS